MPKDFSVKILQKLCKQNPLNILSFNQTYDHAITNRNALSSHKFPNNINSQ